MQIDAAKVLGLVTRQVRHFDKDGKPASAVVLARAYDTSVEDLWEAVTSKERVPRWFLPLEGDLKLGGRYQLIGNAGGTITACTPPHHFAATWEFGGGTSWIDVTVADARDSVLEFDAVKRHKDASKTKLQALLTLEHTAFIEDHWNQFGPGAVGVGWDLCLAGLDMYLASGTPIDPAAAEAWMGSPNGKDFVGANGELWRAAHVAGGAEAAVAKASAERTIAFYRGEPPPDVAHPGTGG